MMSVQQLQLRFLVPVAGFCENGERRTQQIAELIIVVYNKMQKWFTVLPFFLQTVQINRAQALDFVTLPLSPCLCGEIIVASASAVNISRRTG